MASSIRSATRYTTSNSLTSSTKSDPSSSAEFSSTSRAVVKKQSSAATTQINFSSMVKKFVDTKKAKNFNRDHQPKLVVAADFLAEDLTKNGGGKVKGGGLSGLHKKLFKGSVKGEKESSKKALALTEVKGNTRTLAMVLRSERELLSSNKVHEAEIAELKVLLEEKNGEVEKLKDLCLKQREEIKSLKSAILFPDVMNSQLQDVLEKQGSELNQAKQLIPSLQRQVSSLTGQLQSLAEGLAEVKADKYSGRGYNDNHFSSPRTPSYDQEYDDNFLFDQDFSSGDYTTPDTPDDMFIKDLNPCLTPRYSKTKSKEFNVFDSPDDGELSIANMHLSPDSGFNSCVTKLSKSSDSCQSSKTGKTIICAARRSDQTKCTFGKPTHHRLF